MKKSLACCDRRRAAATALRYAKTSVLWLATIPQFHAACLLGCLVAPQALAGEPAAGLSRAEQASYLADLQRLYLSQDERQALPPHRHALRTRYAPRRF